MTLGIVNNSLSSIILKQHFQETLCEMKQPCHPKKTIPVVYSTIPLSSYQLEGLKVLDLLVKLPYFLCIVLDFVLCHSQQVSVGPNPRICCLKSYHQDLQQLSQWVQGRFQCLHDRGKLNFTSQPLPLVEDNTGSPPSFLLSAKEDKPGGHQL